jgi:hypothetical protein
VNFSETERIIPHLNAAATLCHSRSFDTAPTTYLRGLLFEIFCYIFVLTAFSHGHRLPLQLGFQIINSPLLSGSYCQGVLLGRRCRAVFSCILKVSMLTSGTLTLGEATAVELRTLEAQLEGYAPTEHEFGGSSDEETTAELYRLACLVHIKKTLQPKLDDCSPAIQVLIGDFITTLGRLPHTSPANNILCWPLMVAGMASVVFAHRRLIVGRLRKNHETWRSDILSTSADLLSRKWREARTSEGIKVSQGIDTCHVEACASSCTWQVSQFPVVFL